MQSSSRSNEPEPHTELPNFRILHCKAESPKCLTLKASGAYFGETQKAVGNRASTLKEHTQNFTHSETQGRSNNLKEARDRSICCSCKVSCRERKNYSSCCAHRPWWQALYRELILSDGRWCWQASFWKTPSSLLAPGPSPTHQPVGTSTGTPQAKQLAGQEHSPTYQ